MNQPQSLIAIGKVGRAHGIKGEIRVFPDDPDSASLRYVREIYVGEEKRRYHVLHVTSCNRFEALTLDGITDRDEAFALTGLTVYIDRAALKPLRKAYYACDLKGLQIIDENGKCWGVVCDVLPNGAQDMLRYATESGVKGLIPFVSEYVGDVDLDAKTVQVDASWMASIHAVYEG